MLGSSIPSQLARAAGPKPNRFRRAPDFAIAAAILAFLSWALAWKYSLFASGVFGYHELTLISDCFSNALVHGRPFWLTDGAKSHLTVHFTPSLLLLTPWFAFFHGQFALIAISVVAFCAAMFTAAHQLYGRLQRK
jgi:uncharacterized membrane protein